MAELPEELFLESLQALTEVDRAWVPADPAESLYFRPFMIATEVGLGVNSPSGSYTYLLIASPAGAYFSGGVKPVKVWLSTEYTRAAPGGTGEAKCAGNYAAAFVAQAHATAQGCDQVVWLDAAEHRWVEEMGGMNLYFVYGSGPGRAHRHPGADRHAAARRHPRLAAARWPPTSATPPRRARSRPTSGATARASGAITEVFACGTAAVVTPVGAVDSAAGGWTIGDGSPGPVTMQLREHLLGIQTGQPSDTARLDAPARSDAVTRSRVRPGRSPAAALLQPRSGVRLLPGRWLPVMSSHRRFIPL